MEPDGRLPDSEYTGTAFATDPVADLIDYVAQAAEPAHHPVTPDRHPRPAEYAGSARLVMTNDEIADDPERWHAERRGDPETGTWRLTASQMAAVLGLAPAEHGGPFSLYHAKLSGEESFTGNDRTDLGLYLEGFTAARFARRFPELDVREGGLYVSKQFPWLAATFDRIAWVQAHACGCPQGAHCGQGHVGDLVEVPAGPVQLKTWANMSQFGQDGSAVMPVYLRVQLLCEIAVLGTDIGWEPVLPLPAGRVRVMVLERDQVAERDIAAILAGGEQFIGMLDQEQEPELDWKPSTTAALRRLYPRVIEGKQARVPGRLAGRYQRARAASAKAEERLKLAQNELRYLGGDAEELIAYDPITGLDAVVCKRSGGPRAGYSVEPLDWVERMLPGDWGKPLI